MLNSTYMQNFNIAVIQQGSTKVGAAQKSRVHSMADYNTGAAEGIFKWGGGGGKL